jgi:hypothetical protein
MCVSPCRTQCMCLSPACALSPAKLFEASGSERQSNQGQLQLLLHKAACRVPGWHFCANQQDSAHLAEGPSPEGVPGPHCSRCCDLIPSCFPGLSRQVCSWLWATQRALHCLAGGGLYSVSFVIAAVVFVPPLEKVALKVSFFSSSVCSRTSAYRTYLFDSTSIEF